jgi:hypothetical protein
MVGLMAVWSVHKKVESLVASKVEMWGLALVVWTAVLTVASMAVALDMLWVSLMAILMVLHLARSKVEM